MEQMNKNIEKEKNERDKGKKKDKKSKGQKLHDNLFKSSETIKYYVSANPDGRLLNNLASIEMLSCDQPYYYTLNYHVV